MTRLRCGRDLLAGDLTFPGAGRITILAPEPHLRRQAGPSTIPDSASRLTSASRSSPRSVSVSDQPDGYATTIVRRLGRFIIFTWTVTALMTIYAFFGSDLQHLLQTQ